MPLVNPDVLTWARNTSGLSEEEAAQAIALGAAKGASPAERLRKIEAGEEEPSRALLRRMAKKYRRPLLALYLPHPPTQGQRGEDFRTVADPESEPDNRLDALLRGVRVRHSILLSALEDEEELEPLPFVGSMRLSDGIEKVTQSVRKALGLDLERFRRGGYDDGFRYLRTAVESIGVFVILQGDLGSHHSKIFVSSFRGYAIADVVAPFIVLNDNDARPAMSFTLLHELAHIWLGASGVSDYSQGAQIEKFCNQVAANLLLDKRELRELSDIAGEKLEDQVNRIQIFARTRNLSGEMVTYSLVKASLLKTSSFDPIRAELRRRYRIQFDTRKAKAKERDGGPNYYVLRRYSTGDRLLSYTRRLLDADVITPSKAGLLLGVKPTMVPRVVEEAS